jgi:hypothetical protein
MASLVSDMRLDPAMGRIRTPSRDAAILQRLTRKLLGAISAPFSRTANAKPADNHTDMLWLLLASDPDGIWYSAAYLNSSVKEPLPDSNEEDQL